MEAEVTDPRQLIAVTALNEMLRGSHFNICTIDAIAEMLGVPVRGSHAYCMLRPLHCINYANMPSELRQALPGLIREILGVEPAYQFPLPRSAAEEIPVPRRGLLRLLGRGQ